jgi:sugar (pentulose or hexulose) kinase
VTRDLLLAIDVGTQSVRALLFDPIGEVVAKVQLPIEPYRAPQPGWAEQDAELYWQMLVQACQTLWATSGIPPARVVAMAVTTLRATVICLDEAGRPLRPAIVWLDQRRADALAPLPLGWRVLLAAGGATDLVGSVRREAEANWLAQHEPQVWRATRKFVFLSGYLAFRLCGDYVDATASQVGYVPFDYRRQQWAAPRDWRWRAFPVRPDQLPRLVPAGTRMGDLSEAAAQCLGLPAGLPLMAAGADKACEVLGCGLRPGREGALSLGTSATINTVQPRYLEVQSRLPAYPAAMPGAFNTEIQIHRGFWMVSWFKREFAQREQVLAAERGVAVESLFDELLREVPAGSHGLTLQPYWSPGVREPGPEAKGAIIGFGDVHSRAHLYRAIIEGLAYGLRAGKQTIERRLRAPLTRMVASGGGSQSDAAMQILADVFAMPVERPHTAETSALGAAINAAVGCGLYVNHAAAITAMCRCARRFEPDPTAVALYDALYRDVYAPLYGRLKPIYQRLRRITGYPA